MCHRDIPSANHRASTSVCSGTCCLYNSSSSILDSKSKCIHELGSTQQQLDCICKYIVLCGPGGIDLLLSCSVHSAN